MVFPGSRRNHLLRQGITECMNQLERTQGTLVRNLRWTAHYFLETSLIGSSDSQPHVLTWPSRTLYRLRNKVAIPVDVLGEDCVATTLCATADN